MMVKSIGGAINWILMKALKATNKNYIAYHSLSMKESIITKGFRKIRGAISVAIDGASHDSH
jgi:hypothetical protein